jgi:hypothetical protein
MGTTLAPCDSDVFSSTFCKEICRACLVPSCTNKPESWINSKKSPAPDDNGQESVSAEACIAARYISGEPEQSIIPAYTHIYADFEGRFPFFFLPQDRRYTREEIWSRIESMGESTLLRCRSAIINFSRLLIAEHALSLCLKDKKTETRGWIICYENQLKRLTDLSKDGVRPSTQISIMAEIENVRAKLNSLKPRGTDYVEDLLRINHILNERSRKLDSNAFKDQTSLLVLQYSPREVLNYLTGLVSKSAMTRDLPRSGMPDDITIRTAIPVVMISLQAAASGMNDAAEITAELINEYCFRNPIFRPIVKKELGMEETTDIYNRSDIKRYYELYSQ